ncbi:hypothetical protein O988_07991 [Pseudogymnoascus sp. VKM F-3808]|nr:hypothetical protein O988_07991 [Pseudogymnoascus sp. VKM F-3808]
MSGKVVEKTVYLGTFAHSKSLKELEIAHNAAIFVDESGKIVAVERGVADEAAAKSFFPKLNWSESQEKPIRIFKSKEEQFFFPGFIGNPSISNLQTPANQPADTHIHASQYPNAGIFGKSTLLDWLNTYTFPMEASLSTLPTAQRVYARVIARTLSHGTTTAAYYATISVPATNLLADLCLAAGQRALVGRCCMDSLAPDYYRDASAEQSIADTQATIAHIASIDPSHALVKPIITPRFAPSCSSALLTGLGKLQKETGLPVQTHISENKREIDLVAQLFPQSKSYAEVYDTHGLLGPKTVLAHAVHITDEERALIKERGAGISHCPVSNAALASGMAEVRTWLDDGISVGLGTDVSGGYSPSVLEAVRQSLLCSRNLAMGEAGDDAERRKLSVEEALYLGTVGGAKVVGMEGKVGAFEVGMEWDAQLVGMEGVGLEGGFEGADGGPVDIFGWESWENKLAKWVFNGDDRNTLAVWPQQLIKRLCHLLGQYVGPEVPYIPNNHLHALHAQADLLRVLEQLLGGVVVGKDNRVLTPKTSGCLDVDLAVDAREEHMDEVQDLRKGSATGGSIGLSAGLEEIANGQPDVGAVKGRASVLGILVNGEHATGGRYEAVVPDDLSDFEREGEQSEWHCGGHRRGG